MECTVVKESPRIWVVDGSTPYCIYLKKKDHPVGGLSFLEQDTGVDDTMVATSF